MPPGASAAQIQKQQQAEMEAAASVGPEGQRTNGTLSSWFSRLGSGASEKKMDADVESQSSLLPGAPSWFTVPRLSVDPEAAPSNLFGISYQTRFKGFVTCVLLAAVFFFLAFAIGLPVIVLRPHKFALCFTLGSVLFMSSFSLLVGPMNHLKSMLSQERLPFTLMYLGSMIATLYAALVVRSYLLVVGTSSLQIGIIGYYFLASIPGGLTGFRVFVSMFVRVVRHLLGPCVKGIWAAFNMCLKVVSS